MKFTLVVFFATVVALQAGSDFEYYKSKKVLATDLRAVIIAPEGESPPDYIRGALKGTEFYRITFEGNRKKQQELQKKINTLAIEKPLTVEVLERIKKEIAAFYKDSKEALVTVTAQEQEMTDGVLVFNVLESRLGEVSVVGNKWFSPELYTECISIEPDQVIVDTKVEKDIAWANRSPYRKVDAVYKPGKAYGTTDIELNIQDQFPFHLFSGVDNTGFPITQTGRFFVGCDWGNVLDMDQTLSFQYTSSLNFSSFQSATFNYIAPLPWRNLLLFHGEYTSVEVSPAQQGKSWQLGFRYAYPFFKGNFHQQVDLGFEHKATNNNVIVGEKLISNQIATILELVGRYQGGFSQGQHTFNGALEGYFQPWSIGESMSRQTYALLRPDCSPYYGFFKLGGEYRWLHQSGAMIKVRATAQIASAPLLPIEQFGLGGENSLRGYPERVVNSDQGLVFNLDLFTPSLKMIPFITKNRPIQDSLRGVLFFDVGFASSLDTPPTELNKYFLAGIGPGFRYDITPSIFFRFDYGFRLTDAIFNSSSSTIGQPYFSATAAY